MRRQAWHSEAFFPGKRKGILASVYTLVTGNLVRRRRKKASLTLHHVPLSQAVKAEACHSLSGEDGGQAEKWWRHPRSHVSGQ